jgi:type I restriction enzyme, S subunit
MAPDSARRAPEWTTRELGEILEHVIDFRGRTPKKLGMDWGGGTIPALSANNVKMGGVNLSEPTFYGSDALYKRWMTSGESQPGDVLITMEAPLGNVAQVPDDERYILSQRVVLLRFDPRTAVNAFVAHQLRSERAQRNLELWSTGTTATGIQRARLVRVPLSIPPLAEQRQISAILDTIDDAIRKTEQIIAKLKQVKQGLLHDLLTRGVDENGELRDPERRPEKFKDSPLGRIPIGWEVRPLGACVHSQSPITYGIVQAGPHVPDGVPYIRTGDMSGDRLALDGLLRTSARIAASFTRSQVRTAEIVCAIRATVGKVLPIPSELDGANLTQGTARIAPAPEIVPGFLLWALRSHGMQRQFDLSVKGTTFREITLAQLRLLLVPVPLGRQEQDRIALVMQSAVKREEAEIAECHKLRLMKAGLMEDLLTGRVRVTKLLGSAAE